MNSYRSAISCLELEVTLFNKRKMQCKGIASETGHRIGRFTPPPKEMLERVSHSATQLSKSMTAGPTQQLEPLSPTLLSESRERVNFQGHKFREDEENSINQRKGIWNKHWGVGRQPAQHEPAGCPGGQEGQRHPGLDQEWCGQQDRGL